MRVFKDMEEKDLEILFQRYINKTATEEEKLAFFLFISQPGADAFLKVLADRYPVPDYMNVKLPEQASNEIVAAILATEDHVPVHRVHFMRRFRWAAAAIIIVALSGIVFLINHRQAPPDSVKARVQPDIKAPETNKATITLPGGERIMLDSVPNGSLIAGVVRKTADGEFIFEGKLATIGYIVASNPRNSKTMRITLPDNTQVWLNADTYLQYPTDYNTKDRLVILKGEAYFEVKHNADKPFRVSAGEQSIEDIGTHFNVKAYPDENQVQTTLLEGAVNINRSVVLKKGDQYSNNKVAIANMDEVNAWRNGSFYLDGREIGNVAIELGRWYDVDVVFNNEPAKHNTLFGGEMGRDLSLAQAIRILNKMNVRASLQGGKLILE